MPVGNAATTKLEDLFGAGLFISHSSTIYCFFFWCISDISGRVLNKINSCRALMKLVISAGTVPFLVFYVSGIFKLNILGIFQPLTMDQVCIRAKECNKR